MCPIVVVAVGATTKIKKEKKGASQPVELTQWPKRQQGDNCPALTRLGLGSARLGLGSAWLGWSGLACASSAAFWLVIYFMSTLTCQTIQSGFASVFPESCHSGRGGSQLPAIKHAIAALVSDVPVVVLVAVAAGCECDILRVSVSHCCLVGLKQKAPNATAHNARR